MPELSDLAAVKRAARAEAYARRERIHAGAAGAARLAAAHALGEVAQLRGVERISGYLPIRSEIDPRPLMRAFLGLDFQVCVPVIEHRGQPLRFRAWTPAAPILRGHHGIDVPAEGAWFDPEFLVVPLLAFDARGHRLGYGGGYYDRTIAHLRESGDVRAVGIAYAGQEIEAVPDGDNDMRLDAIVTERGIVWPK
ncbi:MAG TPA: 5-formyltetrahydrofolate cyclo-ligase [Amaricoccus sp.]|uniref:5-formyltetrahydrofolate cyclo-ligase n=1 Tax=Amaricoccus sp. TaxID=1872485 RepID=UPI002B58A35E|nr:5-formyltetrahydrofolate cyclo-ligase [Amaricoccus sp.]HPG22492.1 5-formyltetrahydrofolate cyclo-ligase [Amaricoccus sp.]HRW16276.1 5-formyltetrahydrofolate cyclo-ligase [Amaricoccus sp.]